MAATLGGGAIGVPSFSSHPSRLATNARAVSSPSSLALSLQSVSKTGQRLRCVIVCSTVQESSASTLATEKEEAETADKEEKEAKTAEEKPQPVAAATKPKAAATKAPAKPLTQMMEEDVIPPLKAILEAQDDVSDLELSFQDNKLEGSFLKQGNPYSFWAFFPTGNLTGAKGFALSSYGSEASTVEPFLVDEKKPTAQHVVFWVEKRLAAQGIIPVWKE